MADVRGFRGLYYNPTKVSSLVEVVSPPYDVISPEQRTEYLRKSPWNIVHLTLPEGDQPYENARTLFEQWLAEEVFVQDQESSMYYYHQTFKTPEGESKTRKGFFTIVRIENFEKKIVLPHEATLFAPKEDRLNLLRATRAHLEPILSLYSDPEQKIEALLEPLTEAPPRSKVEDEFGNRHSIWAIKEPATVRQLQELMKENFVLIADGHHRYESALMYRDEMSKENQDPEAPFHFMLMMLANIHQPGIHVLPYNRGIKNLPKFEPREILKKAASFFEIHEFEEKDQAALALKKEGAETTALLALLQNQRSYYLFRLKPNARIAQFYPPGTPEAVQRLDVNILHKVFIHGILSISEEEIQNQKYLKYYKDTKEEMKDFEAGRLQIAFFLNPTRVDQVVEVSRAGEKMPQKSTFFYPKLMSGFVLYKH